MSLYLSRLTLRRDPSVNALRSLIDPAPMPARNRLHDPTQGRIMDAHHKLLWTVFGDDPDRKRDFLWRSEGQGRFLVLSRRVPDDAGTGLFQPPQVKPFAPVLHVGDRLDFVLRANATRTRRKPDDSNGRASRVDVVMDALHPLPKADPASNEPSPRALARPDAVRSAGLAWLTQQGVAHGFSELVLGISDYRVVPLLRAGPRQGQPQFGVLDMGGSFTVTDPVRLVARIGEGLGRARAFGCGLMLIRRV